MPAASDQAAPTRPAGAYPSPLSGKYANLPPLAEDKADDGKSFLNPPAEKPSETYEHFAAPLDNGQRGAFDVHIYYHPDDEGEIKYARELRERIRREFPEIRMYQLWPGPVGPHPLAMFEVNLLTPAQFGALVPWLAIWRGPLPVLVHPNTVPGTSQDQDAEAEEEDLGLRELRNHTERAMWMGPRLELDTSPFFELSEQFKARKAREAKDKDGGSL